MYKLNKLYKLAFFDKIEKERNNKWTKLVMTIL